MKFPGKLVAGMFSFGSEAFFRVPPPVKEALNLEFAQSLNFDIAAYLTEIILLGCVALRVGKKLEWDGPKILAQNAPEAAHIVRRENRKGWEL